MLMSENKKKNNNIFDYSKYIEDCTDYEEGQTIKVEQKENGDKKYWLCFYVDESESAREDCNTYYSYLVLASSREDAIKIFAGYEDYDDDQINMSRYDAILPNVYFKK
jgi:hypothetical protein